MNKINVGLFVDDLDKDKELIHKVYNDIESSRSNVIDFSIFFNRVGKINNQIKCGFFNSANLTDFSGHLICYNLDATKMAQSVVNDIKLYVLCDQFSVIDYFELKKKDNKVNYIVMDDKQNKNFYRVTGNHAAVYNGNILDIIRDINHE
jgi:hypothetical protein